MKSLTITYVENQARIKNVEVMSYIYIYIYMSRYVYV